MITTIIYIIFTLNIGATFCKYSCQCVTTKPTTRHCKTCRRVVLAALADDGPGVSGMRVTLDPRPVTPLGELIALSAGLATWAHIGGAITWRCTIRIRTSPPGTKYDVHHSHVCTPIPGIEYAQPIHRPGITTTKSASPIATIG